MISGYFYTTERQWVIINEDIQAWGAESVALSGYYMSGKNQILSHPPGKKCPHILKTRRDNNTGINSQDREDENEIKDGA
jgi:hypothetical protein